MLNTTISQPEQGRCVVALAGRLDTATAPLCEQKIAPVINNPKIQVLVFDLEMLEYISSMGLRVIFKTRKALESQGRTLMMIHLQPQIAKVFEIAAALPKETIFTSMEEADRYLAVMQQKAMRQ